VPWAGFRHEPVWYDRHARAAGETKYSARKLIMLAADALVISSDAPVRLTWACSLSLVVIGLSATAIATWSSFHDETTGAQRAGVSLTAIIAVAALVGAAQTAAVAIVGEYAVRTYRESQGRPTSVVRRTINAAATSAPGNARPDRSRAA
jgi:dolichol-phosphate mannosyltransferase